MLVCCGQRLRRERGGWCWGEYYISLLAIKDSCQAHTTITLTPINDVFEILRSGRNGEMDWLTILTDCPNYGQNDLIRSVDLRNLNSGPFLMVDMTRKSIGSLIRQFLIKCLTVKFKIVFGDFLKLSKSSWVQWVFEEIFQNIGNDYQTFRTSRETLTVKNPCSVDIVKLF